MGDSTESVFDLCFRRVISFDDKAIRVQANTSECETRNDHCFDLPAFGKSSHSSVGWATPLRYTPSPVETEVAKQFRFPQSNVLQ